MRKYFIFFTLIYLISTNVALANTTATGFIPGQIWYSKDTIIEGDTVKIYTAVWNNASSTLSAKVEFYDQNVLLGTRDVVVAPSELVDTYVSWKVTSGDHIITAKIISPSITVGGKKEIVVIDNNSTESSRKFIPVVIKKIDGEPVTSSDLLQNQIDKATSSISDILPDSVSTPISENIDVVSKFRVETFDKISSMKDETKKLIDSLSSASNATTGKVAGTSKTVEKVTPVKTSDNGTEKPIAYIKLFFLSVLSFIFGSGFVFYALIVLVLFFVVRLIYRKIRKR
ncbi:MAG: hypothetical protein WC241_02415 [Candidatus Paceibacterota bacterium]|jgi:hypothetical protein